jgi:hypothetical protein
MIHQQLLPTFSMPSYFFLPHITPLFISFSTSRKSVSAAAGPCCETWRINALTMAELLTVRPRKSEASCLSRRSARSASPVSLNVRIGKGAASFRGGSFVRALW